MAEAKEVTILTMEDTMVDKEVSFPAITVDKEVSFQDTTVDKEVTSLVLTAAIGVKHPRINTTAARERTIPSTLLASNPDAALYQDRCAPGIADSARPSRALTTAVALGRTSAASTPASKNTSAKHLSLT